jgi:hypothetical protein
MITGHFISTHFRITLTCVERSLMGSHSKMYYFSHDIICPASYAFLEENHKDNLLNVFVTQYHQLLA